MSITLKGRDPRLSPAGYLAHSRQGTIVIRDLRTLGVLAEHPGNRVRLDGATASWRQQKDDDDLKFTLRAVASAPSWQASVVDSGLSGDVFEAAGGHWYMHRKVGVNTLYRDGEPYLVGEEYGPLVAAQGDYLAIHMRDPDQIRIKHVSSGTGEVLPSPIVPWSLDVCEGYTVISHGKTIGWTGWTPEGYEDDLTVVQGEQRARLFIVDGVMWVVSEVPHPSGEPNRIAAFARPWGEQEGLLFHAAGGFLRGICYQGEIVIASSDTIGTLIVDRLPVDSPRKRLEEYCGETPTVRPFNRHLWAGYFHQYRTVDGMPDDNPSAPGNVTVPNDDPAIARVPRSLEIVVPPSARAACEALGRRPKALYVVLEDTMEAVEAEVSRARNSWPGLPVVTYSGKYNPTRRLAGVDYHGVQVYPEPGMTAADLLAYGKTAFNALPADVKIALIAGAYDRNGNITDIAELTRCQAVYPRLARDRRVKWILWFSDGRAGGTRSHPSLRPWHQATVNAIKVRA